jgi:SPOR domain
MKIKILLIAAFLSFAALFCLYADSYWEGAASMSRYGEFPVKGYYGASNSFPLNSIVEVNNPAGNKKVEIIIVNKLDDNNLFILLSKDASEKLDINEDQIVSVKAKVVKQFMPEGSRERELTADPDYNPVISMDDEKVFVEKIPESEGEYVEEKDLADEIIETIIFSDIPLVESIPEDVDEIVEEEIPESDGYDGPEVIITEIIEGDVIEEAEIAKEEVISDDSEEELFETYNPDEIIAAPVKTEDTLEYEEKLVLVPSGPKPPEGETSEYTAPVIIPEISPEETFAEVETPGADALDSNSFYLQIGAYKDYSAADSLIKTIELDYPVFLYTKGENGIYRVMAGPLKQDEKGAALYQVRIKGMKDAFIRKGE